MSESKLHDAGERDYLNVFHLIVLVSGSPILMLLMHTRLCNSFSLSVVMTSIRTRNFSEGILPAIAKETNF